MLPMDTYATAHTRYVSDPGLNHLIVRDADIEAVRAALPWWWTYEGRVTVADGYPEDGGRFVHGPFVRILKIALDRRWDLLWPWEQAYALSRGVR